MYIFAAMGPFGRYSPTAWLIFKWAGCSFIEAAPSEELEQSYFWRSRNLTKHTLYVKRACEF